MVNPLGDYGVVIDDEWPPIDKAHLIHVGVMTLFGFLIGYLVKKAMK